MVTSLQPAPDGYPIKLVRDRTPAIINASGEPGDLFYGPVPAGERHRWLRLKLAEEVGEYLVDGGPREIRDVFVVVLELALEHGMDLDRLMAAVRSDERGLFRDGVMMYGRHPEFDVGTRRRERS
jgi:predicted house-cleaning noncanonical NTP pyrophosphatase (MazG superfamily)